MSSKNNLYTQRRLRRRCVLTLFVLIFLSFVSCKKLPVGTTTTTLVVLNKQSDLVPHRGHASYGAGIVNADRLRLRYLNDLHSKTLCYMDKGTVVNILGRDKERVHIDEFDDYWYNIEFNRIKGWVFGAYLDVYGSVEDARAGAVRYLRDKPEEHAVESVDDAINYNLFFLSGSRMFQVTDVSSGQARVVPIAKMSGYGQIVSYYFAKDETKLYYLARPAKSDPVGGNALFSADINTGESVRLAGGIHVLSVNIEQNSAVTLSYDYDKAASQDYWLIRIFDFGTNRFVRDVVRIAKPADGEVSEDVGGAFVRTQRRETGSLSLLDWDANKDLVYFRPYEENQTYIISMQNGTWTKMDWVNNNLFDIDSSRYLYIRSDDEQNGKSMYSLLLKDRITGIEKTVIQSQYYPFNFALSPHKGYVAVTMTVVTDDPMVSYFNSSVYVLSLSTYILTPISTDGTSYQPKWSYNDLKPVFTE
ncbi:MAG: hypothetical protein IKN25_04030 [Spirochaetales bacterium]|nr:hypothetical protein [Spirochaetales bacterium]MBR6062462.1 hypothetical protein [Spirochaetales bacterium]